MPSDETYTLKPKLGMEVHKERTKFYVNTHKLKELLKSYFILF